MTCAYHPGQPVSASCQSCRRSLCRACDHRIRGLPYCQDCIVAGIELLRKQPTNPTFTTLQGNHRTGSTSRRSLLVALLFSLFPGLGAVYNGQNVKAFIHFILIAGLWTLADQFTASLEALLVAAGALVYLFSILNACRTAQRANRGIDLQLEDERIRAWLSNNIIYAGYGLIIIGSLTTINALAPSLLNRFWPIILVLTGTALLKVRWKRR